MKKITFFTMIAFMTTTINAQTILFQENFETSPITSILNTWNFETQLTNGPSPCSLASRGNTADFNSTNVDFQNSQNSSYFLAVNPEAPCAGFYNASLSTSVLDFSTATDSIIFKCKYFKSTTLNWGPSQLEIIFNNGSLSDTIISEFSTTDNWDNVEVKLPSFVTSPTVTITINMGGGEGVAIDDIEVLGYNVTTVLSEILTKSILIYPNPTQEFIYLKNSFNKAIQSVEILTTTGQIIKSEEISNSQDQNRIDISDFKEGVYFLIIKFDNSTSETYKFINQ